MTHSRTIRPYPGLTRGILLGSIAALGLVNQAFGSIITFEGAGSTPASITATRDAFRQAVGGGTTAGANGDFGGVRREINWDGVPAAASDPALMPADFFNVNSPRGAVFSTPGTGFLVSSDSGSTMFGFPGDLQTFSPNKLFTALNSSVVDVNFFVPGTNIAATTSAFGLIFVDVELADSTRVEFFDQNDNLIFSRLALVAGNQGFSFLGGVADAGERIARVRITAGTDPLISNGVRTNEDGDFVAMDDFLYATPEATATPEPGSLTLFGGGFVVLGML